MASSHSTSANSILREEPESIINPEANSDASIVIQHEASRSLHSATIPVINLEAKSDAIIVIHHESSRSLHSATIPAEVCAVLPHCASAMDVPGSAVINLVDILNIHASEVFQLGRPLAETASTASYSCRFCQQSDTMEMLTSPCNCKGTVAYIHVSCLKRWLNQAGRNYCELCQFQFKTVETRRYSVCRSLRLWVCHPNHRNVFRNNSLVIGLLTFFVFSIVIVVMLGMQHFITEGNKIGIATKWITGVVGFFLATVIIVYCMTLQLFIQDLFGPWWHWWRRCVNVELVFERPMKRAPKPVRRNHTT